MYYFDKVNLMVKMKENVYDYLYKHNYEVDFADEKIVNSNEKEFGKYELEFDKFFDHSMMHSAFAMRIFRINEVAIPGAN